MPDRSPFSDESVLQRWMKLEMGKINEGLVAERKTLSRLLSEENPASVTRGGKEYRFDPGALRSFARDLPSSLRDTLKLPMLCYFDMDVPDSCYFTDETAVEALKTKGSISELRTFRDHRLWVGRALVYAILRDYPTLVQIVMG